MLLGTPAVGLAGRYQPMSERRVNRDARLVVERAVLIAHASVTRRQPRLLDALAALAGVAQHRLVAGAVVDRRGLGARDQLRAALAERGVRGLDALAQPLDRLAVAEPGLERRGDRAARRVVDLCDEPRGVTDRVIGEARDQQVESDRELAGQRTDRAPAC